LAKVQDQARWFEIENTKNVRTRNIEVSIINYMKDAYLPTERELNRIRNAYGITEDGKEIIDRSKWIGNKRTKTLERLQKSINPILLRRDNYVQRAIQNEWTINYFSQAYYTDSVVIGELASSGVTGVYSSAIVPPSKQAFARALKNLPLTIPEKYRQVRGEFISRIYQVIESGVNAGLSVQQITKQIDQLYGFRDSSGKLVISKEQEIDFVGPGGNKSKRRPRSVNPRIPSGGQTYNSIRIVRTEMSMMRSDSAISSLAQAQSLGIDERLIKLATLDSGTREQSAGMDGQISREDGKFRYPDGSYYFRGQTGNPRWDINDRGDAAPYIEGFEPEFRRERVVKTGKNVVHEYRTFADYAQEYGLKKSIYGERYYFNG
jgi:hypothetical protein